MEVPSFSDMVSNGITVVYSVDATVVQRLLDVQYCSVDLEIGI